MTSQPNTRQNTRTRDRLRFRTAPTGAFSDLAVVSMRLHGQGAGAYLITTKPNRSYMRNTLLLSVRVE